MIKDLSVLIPARNEMFLARTIQDLLDNIEADTEIIAVLDGAWANPGIPQHERVNVIYVPASIGQRAATNLGAKIAQGKYVMKVDAHCAFDKGFDRKMLEGFEKVGDNVTMVGIMRNLWAFDWKCYRCGSRWYQGPTPTRCMKQEGNKVVPNEACPETKNIRRKMVWRSDAKPGESGYMNWKGKRSPANYSYCFDSEPHFQYFSEYRKRPEYQEQLKTGFTESMSLQGSCFMATREKYWELGLSDEKVGNWGSQGIQVALATWLSGGRVLVNHSTWYAHLFRTSGDFSFPYPQSVRVVQTTKQNVKKLFWENKHHKQIYPVSWLVKKFWPVPGWDDESSANLKAVEKNRKEGDIA